MSKKRTEIKEELVTLKNNFGEFLVGDISFPEKLQEKYPAVLLVHGFGVDREDNGLFTDLSETLTTAGYLVFKFDFSGCGDSDGDYSETSLTKLKSDLEKIMEFVRAYPKVDKNKIGILAQSFGTCVTVALVPDVQAMVLTGSFAHPYEVMKNLFKEDFNPNGVSTRTRSSGGTTSVKAQFWSEMENYDLLKEIEKINCPILFIHGEVDDKVPVSEGRALYQGRESNSEFVIEKGANHDLRPRREAAYLIAEDWFNKHLKDR